MYARRLRVVGPQETCPLPEHPVLAATAATLNATGHWAEVYDAEWCGVYMTDDARRIFGGRIELAPYTPGAPFLGRQSGEQRMAWRGGHYPLEIVRQTARMYLPSMLADAGGDRQALRERVDPRLHDLVDELDPFVPPPAWPYVFRGIYTRAGAQVDVRCALSRLRDETGRVVGTTVVIKPAVGMAVLARMTALGDQRHFERLERVATPGRRPSAILFADLEASSSLVRRLSTASYFALVRRLARAADHSVVDAGGLVGQHAGDGVAAFFLAETAGSESAAARASITAARTARAALPAVAARCEVAPAHVVLRFGLHWGANLYVGQIATSGRTEVTALGDQVNEAARVEACATGGRTLATKDLVERLDRDDATALGVDPEHVTYTALADLATATEKARRDAPALAVCDV
jgi:class 3 adenylate cyclase